MYRNASVQKNAVVLLLLRLSSSLWKWPDRRILTFCYIFPGPKCFSSFLDFIFAWLTCARTGRPVKQRLREHELVLLALLFFLFAWLFWTSRFFPFLVSFLLLPLPRGMMSMLLLGSGVLVRDCWLRSRAASETLNLASSGKTCVNACGRVREVVGWQKNRSARWVS